jgi:hypothetical protein
MPLIGQSEETKLIDASRVEEFFHSSGLVVLVLHHAERTGIGQSPRRFKLIEFDHLCSVYLRVRKLLCPRTGFYLPRYTLGKQNFPLHSANVAACLGGVPARLV